jgi:hypothetical protein
MGFTAPLRPRPSARPNLWLHSSHELGRGRSGCYGAPRDRGEVRGHGFARGAPAWPGQRGAGRTNQPRTTLDAAGSPRFCGIPGLPRLAELLGYARVVDALGLESFVSGIGMRRQQIFRGAVATILTCGGALMTWASVSWATLRGICSVGAVSKGSTPRGNYG